MIVMIMTNMTLENRKVKTQSKAITALAVITAITTSLITSHSAHAQASEIIVEEAPQVNDENGTLNNTKKSKQSSLNDLVNLYENEQGDYLKLSGRLQLDSAWINSDQGDFNDTLWRRFRFGFKGKNGDFTAKLEADINLNNELGDNYNRLTDANIAWALSKDTKLTFLKQGTGFTLDGKTSSNSLLTPQRNNLTNNLWFTAEYFTGISVKSKITNDWTYHTGVYSTDGSDEVAISEASYFAMFTTKKKLASNNLWDKGEIGFDYVYNDTHEDGNTRDFSQVISASSKFEKNNWGLQSDISWGEGDLGQSDLFGVVLMPSYKQSASIQWVARYTYLNSTEDNGVRLGRYENSVVEERGDKYQEIYTGVNWFVDGHKLKFQAGVQYAKMEDNANDGGAYDGWGFTLAMRSYW